MSVFDDPKIVAEKIFSSIPKIGEKYHFFDDGKIKESRHYIATVIDIITLEDAKNIIITNDCYNKGLTLYQIWKNEVENRDFLYAPETDFLVVCSIPRYDDGPIYFTRTEYGWFSLNVTSGWQSGELDLDGRLYNTMLGYYRDRDINALEAEEEVLGPNRIRSKSNRIAYKCI